MKKYAIVGSTTRTDYSWFLPLTGLMWERVGYEPFFLLAGGSKEWIDNPRGKLPFIELAEMGFAWKFVALPEGVEDTAVSQGARHHAAAMDFDPEDMLVTTDADIWPLSRGWFNQHDPAKNSIGIHYANAHPGEEDSHFPTCYMSATVKVWREIMGITPNKDVSGEFDKSITRTGFRETKGMDRWFHHQKHASKMIRQSRHYAGALRVDRQGQPPNDRIDRAKWPGYPGILGMVDCHLLRPGYTKENYPRIRPIIEQCLGDSLKWADKYAADYRAMMEEGG